jgi:O-methyltransferase/8-demethyl-8-(2,3-dimethoxy-alpha-L-rhamnosyl)tetracenomycin-C 4'-O-methyltransferase
MIPGIRTLKARVRDLNDQLKREEVAGMLLQQRVQELSDKLQREEVVRTQLQERTGALERQLAENASLGVEIGRIAQLMEVNLGAAIGQAAHLTQANINAEMGRVAQATHANMQADIGAEIGRIVPLMRADTERLLSKLAAIDHRQAIFRSRSDAAMNSIDQVLYLNLMEAVLTGMIYEDPPMNPVDPPINDRAFDTETRLLGRDWPSSAYTMIGAVRMRNLRDLIETAVADGIQGDFIETGVWRGGACIYARGIFAAHGIKDRRVWVADSFRGLPYPNADAFPADADDPHHTFSELVVSADVVRRNFERFGLLDEQVKFLEGWFKDTLPNAPIEQLAVLRLDGDMYESTKDALDALYEKVSPMGFVIIDDYILPACRQAVEDFRNAKRIAAPLHEVDGAAVYWRVPVEI